ncbi:MAG: hypothetical protein U0R19_39535 [Bryobacteraceae bacterium]
MYFWLSLLAVAMLGNGHRMAQRWQRMHRSGMVSLYGFGSVQARDIFRLEPYETSVDPEKLKFTFSYDNYTDWGGNSRCSGYLYLYLFRSGGAKPFAIEFDGDRRLVEEMAESLVIHRPRLEQHFQNIPWRSERSRRLRHSRGSGFLQGCMDIAIMRARRCWRRSIRWRRSFAKGWPW